MVTLAEVVRYAEPLMIAHPRGTTARPRVDVIPVRPVHSTAEPHRVFVLASPTGTPAGFSALSLREEPSFVSLHVPVRPGDEDEDDQDDGDDREPGVLRDGLQHSLDDAVDLHHPAEHLPPEALNEKELPVNPNVYEPPAWIVALCPSWIVTTAGPVEQDTVTYRS